MHSNNSDTWLLLREIFLTHPQCFTKSYTKGRYFSDVIDNTPCVGLLERGRLDVYLMILDNIEIHVNTLHQTELFGVSTLGSGKELQTILRCKEDTKLLLLPKTAFLEILSQNKDMLERYVQYTGKKIQFLLEKIRFHCIQSARNKLVTFLLDEMDDDGLVRLDCSRDELCRKLGISRANLFREMSNLKEKRMLICNNKTLKVTSADALVDLLNNI